MLHSVFTMLLLPPCPKIRILQQLLVCVSGVSASEQDEQSVEEGKSVTLDPDLVRQPNEVMRWYYNDILIAEITGYQSKICTDDQCNERFRDRLKLEHQTGSLTITNTRTRDAGLYQLQVSRSLHRSNSATSVKSFGVTISEYNLVPLSNLKTHTQTDFQCTNQTNVIEIAHHCECLKCFPTN